MSFAQNRPVTSETGSYTYKNPGFSPKPRFLYAYDYYFFLQNFISLLILLGKLYLPARNQICFVFFLFYLRLIIICSFPVFEISGEEEIYHYPNNYYNLHFDWQAICQYCIQKIREDSSRHLHSYPFLLSAQRYAHISIK